jgi:hypothetical protein
MVANQFKPGCECLNLCVDFYLPPTAYCVCIWLNSNVYPPFSEIMMSRRNTVVIIGIIIIVIMIMMRTA